MGLERLGLGIALGQAQFLPLLQPRVEFLDFGDVLLFRLDFRGALGELLVGPVASAKLLYDRLRDAVAAARKEARVLPLA